MTEIGLTRVEFHPRNNDTQETQMAKGEDSDLPNISPLLWVHLFRRADAAGNVPRESRGRGAEMQVKG